MQIKSAIPPDIFFNRVAEHKNSAIGKHFREKKAKKQKEKKEKKMEVTCFVLERTCPEEYI